MWTVISLFLSVYVLGALSQEQWLFRATPGGVTAGEGFWGGKIDLSKNGTSPDLNILGYGGMKDILLTSYDPISRSVLFEIQDSQGLMLKKGPACADHAAASETVIGAVRLIDDDNPFLLDRDCGNRCGWSAFVHYDSKIYFVLVGVFGKDRINLTRETQIRMLDLDHKNCPKGTPFVGGSDFHVLKCSSLVATVKSETYEFPDPVIKSWPAATMTVVDRYGRLSFYLQIVDKSVSSKTGLDLMEVNVGGSVNKLYSTQLSNIYGGNFNVRSMGVISFHDDVMCWTAAEHLYCGLFRGDKMIYAGMVLDSGEAFSAGICSGETDSIPTGKILSGVAISSTRDSISIYFGCYPQISGVGGVGLVRISSADWKSKKLYPVTSGGRKVLGGSLFIARSLPQCSVGDVKPPPTTKPPYTIEGPTRIPPTVEPCECGVVGGGAVVSSMSSAVFFVTLLATLLCW